MGRHRHQGFAAAATQDKGANEKLLAELARFQVVRQNRIRDMVARLNELKVPLRADEVFAAPGRAVDGRVEKYLRLHRRSAARDPAQRGSLRGLYSLA